MKNEWTQTLTEQVEGMEKPDAYMAEIEKIGYKYFPKSKVSLSTGTLGSSDVYVRLLLGKDKTEWANGIFNNDPMSLHFAVRLTSKGYVIEFLANSMYITPTDKHLAFGRKKINVRKSTSKDSKALMKNIDKVFKVAKDTVKDAISKNEFDDVYKNRELPNGKTTLEMIKSKV
ncbi:hypothetical protein [uncultured Arcobacter sp.]|uniref:hypothetical protein n=1 Tax=uncultured Arcobacter sp. TaxID=165434 RepID=UPI00262206CD|nr:hypothetical protein [uncultured Arcobacter sp.]